MWFLSNKVLLTKDNLAMRNWNGCQKCCFCDSNESIDHIFMSCPFAKILWRLLFFAYNVPLPTRITNMFGNWLNGMRKDNKHKFRIGVAALCWSLWTSRNDLVFNRQKGTNLLQVIYRATHWIQLWAYLLPEDQPDSMATGCNRLLMVAQDCYFQPTGWRHTKRLENG